ncbi:MAG TPA: mannose-1-phosphate guanylyltransferase/mannose-6-phosphate isomerase [Hyphomicrobiaceae bacterium]|nr:mannose-1-phosphate guanylyltransferase/mannose-6-phosphate isomerase [Hyphomicrobiaceae bacterium]
MTYAQIHPVILCGGSGTRLWPLSRKSHPKQFARLFGGESLLQATVRRLGDIGCSNPVMMTGNDYRFMVGEQLAEIGCQARIVIEPEGRNTAPAIAAAAEMISAIDPDALILVLPSDHLLSDVDDFRNALGSAVAAANDGYPVTFGVTPDRPETGYGYIELSGSAASANEAVEFLRFVEKPDEANARRMLETGRYLWNSGMFLFSVKSLRAMFEKHAPVLMKTAASAVAGGTQDLDFFRLGAGYSECLNISIDYALMEHETGMVVPISGGWNDMGSWITVWRESEHDDEGVAAGKGTLAVDCHDTLLRSEDTDMLVVGLGLKNIIAVATRDAVLVADMDHSEDVKEVVARLSARGYRQAEEFARCHRPWGWYETLALGPRFQVKNIMVKPGGILSLQSHVHRAEHWVVVVGTARVTVGEEVRLLGENESVYIPLGARHRLENPGKLAMHLIEVQTGAYLGEDDIVRYEDVYSRT